MKEDWIDDFNTQILASEYTLIVVGSSIDIFGEFVIHPLKNDSFAQHALYGTTVPQNVYAFVDDKEGTWRLHADFDKGSPSTIFPCTWTLHCMAINNSVVKKFEKQKHDMLGFEKGGALKPPAGL